MTRTKAGREFIYQPATNKSDAAESALSKVLDVFFDGNIDDAVAALETIATKQKTLNR